MAELMTMQTDILSESEIKALFPGDGDGDAGLNDPEPDAGGGDGGKPAGNAGGENDGGDAGDNNDPTKGGDGRVKDPKELFHGPESVGGENGGQGQGDAGNKTNGASPTQNVYSSIARALVDDGIFLNPDDVSPEEVTDSEKFAAMFESEIRSRLDERLRRIDEALGVGADPDAVKDLEGRIGWLRSLKDESVAAENANGESLRKVLIYNDWINHGYDKERATRETEKSFKAGTDVEDARVALKSNMEHYSKAYSDLVESARREQEEERAATQKEADDLHREIIDEGKFVGGLQLDAATRRRVFDNLSKPVWTEPRSGERFTALQRYEYEHRMEFLKNVSLFYTLTNGFKDIEGLVKDRLRQERKRGIDKLESLLGGQAPQSGEMSLMGGLGNGGRQPSVLPDGWRLSD